MVMLTDLVIVRNYMISVMNKFILKREIIANTAILGTLYDGDKILARSLENPYRESSKDSAIPTGKYRCTKDDTGIHRYWKLLNVPGRSNIESHPGNFEADTEGCIIYGKSWSIMKNQLSVTDSVATFVRLKKILPDNYELEIIE